LSSSEKKTLVVTETFSKWLWRLNINTLAQKSQNGSFRFIELFLEVETGDQSKNDDGRNSYSNFKNVKNGLLN